MREDQTLHLLAIHYSFITEIYIAPLQGYYSEALPTLAWLKRSFEAIVKCVRKNPGEQSLHQRKPIPHRGQPPRMHGPGLWRYEQKEQRVTCSNERSELRPLAPRVGQQRCRR